MAEINVPVRAPAARAKPRARKLSTRMDFTPMVDLGFLLITFFMLTTVLAKPVVMPLVMPEDNGGDRSPVKASKVLTLLLGSRDSVYYYEGLDDTRISSTSFSPEGLRKVILDKKERVNVQFGEENVLDKKTGQIGKGSFLQVVIKPGKNSRYKNVVDVLDEMAICRVRYYTLMDNLNPEEASRIQ